MRVSVTLRDELRALADAEGLTLDQTLERLLQRERQRRMGAALAAQEPSPEDQRWLDMSAHDAARG